MADDLVRLELHERAYLALDLSPRFQGILNDALKQGPVTEWDDDLLVTFLRAAFGCGLLAALREPELLDELEDMGFRLRS